MEKSTSILAGGGEAERKLRVADFKGFVFFQLSPCHGEAGITESEVRRFVSCLSIT